LDQQKKLEKDARMDKFIHQLQNCALDQSRTDLLALIHCFDQEHIASILKCYDFETKASHALEVIIIDKVASRMLRTTTVEDILKIYVHDTNRLEALRVLAFKIHKDLTLASACFLLCPFRLDSFKKRALALLLECRKIRLDFDDREIEELVDLVSDPIQAEHIRQILATAQAASNVKTLC
jgi:hypothetical protein